MFTPDGRRVLATNGRICSVYDGETAEHIKQFEVVGEKYEAGQGIKSFVITPDGRTCIILSHIYGAMRSKDREPYFIEWWNLETGVKEKTVDLTASERMFNEIALSHDGATLALRSKAIQYLRALNWKLKASIILRNAETGELLRELPVEQSDVWSPSLMFARGDKSLIVRREANRSEFDKSGRPIDKSQPDLTEWNIADGIFTRFATRANPSEITYFAQGPQLVISSKPSNARATKDGERPLVPRRHASH